MTEVVTLGSVAELEMGLSPSGDTYNTVGDGVPLLNGPTDFGPSHPKPSLFTVDPKRMARMGDILFCVRGSTTGRMNWADRDYAIGRGIASIRGADALETRYLRYCIDHKLPELLKRATGSTFPNLSGKQISGMLIPYMSSRREIAAILSTYDELIQNNRRRIEILGEFARLLFREWFVHFRYPGHNEGGLIESNLGRIPRDWQVQQLGAVLELVYGKALKADNRRGGRVAVYGSGGLVGWHDEALVDGPGIVVGRKGNVGTVYWSDVDFFPIDTTYFVTTDLPLSFAYHLLDTVEFIDSHAAVPGLSRDQAYSIPVVMPEAPLPRQFEEMVAPMLEMRRNLSRQNEVLQQARDFLLPGLVSGKLDVSALDLEASAV